MDSFCSLIVMPCRMQCHEVARLSSAVRGMRFSQLQSVILVTPFLQPRRLERFCLQSSRTTLQSRPKPRVDRLSQYLSKRQTTSRLVVDLKCLKTTRDAGEGRHVG